MSGTGKRRSPREAMWDWFRRETVEPIKPRKKGRSTRAADVEFRCVIRLDETAGRLIVGVWHGNAGEPVGVWYMTRSGIGYGTVDGLNWAEVQLYNLPYIAAGIYAYRSRWYQSDRFEIEREESGCRAWACQVGQEFLGRNMDYSCNGTVEIIHDIGYYGGEVRRVRSKERKRAALNAWADGFPALPDDFEAWIRAVPFEGVHHQFHDKDDKSYGCSACGSRSRGADVAAWRRGQTVVCPACGAVCKVIKHGKTDRQTDKRRVMIVQRYHDRKGKPCSIARHFAVDMIWEVGKESYILDPSVVILLPYDRAADCDDVLYDTWEGWSERNPMNQRAGEGYCYPDLEALRGTVYDGMGLEVAAAQGWRMNYNALMRDFHGDPRVEYLIKGGFRRLVADLAEREHRDSTRLFQVDPSKGAVKAADVLGLDGQGAARLRQHDGGLDHLIWLRSAFMCRWRLSDETWDYLASGGRELTPTLIAPMVDPGRGDLTIEQVANYIKKQTALRRAREREGGKAHFVARLWRDTLEMEERLGIDLECDMNVRPRNLRVRHDELVELCNEENNKMEAAAAEAKFPAVKPVCDRIRAIYEWSDGAYGVVVPTGVYDIQREGRLLSHCVAGNERYLDRIADGESYILFLRRMRDPTDPWYTMEVEPGGKIRQLRTFGDRQGEDRDEAKAFLRKWAKVVHERCLTDKGSRGELEAAAVSHEKRLREFEQLRQDGNIIRNGILKGRLLVEVLENDFRELNEAFDEQQQIGEVS